MNGPSLVPLGCWTLASAAALAIDYWLLPGPMIAGWVLGVNVGLALQQYAEKLKYAATPRGRS